MIKYSLYDCMIQYRPKKYTIDDKLESVINRNYESHGKNVCLEYLENIILSCDSFSFWDEWNKIGTSDEPAFENFNDNIRVSYDPYHKFYVIRFNVIDKQEIDDNDDLVDAEIYRFSDSIED